MLMHLCALHPLVAAFLAAVVVTPALAGGPIEVRRDELPKPIRKLHTCVAAKGVTQMNPLPARAGSAGVIVSVACPLDGPDVVAVKSQKPWQQELHQALYLARNKAGAGTRRLVLPYPLPDGREIMINVVPMTPSVGWSTREHTSKLNGAAFLDLQRRRLPNGEFHLYLQFTPADRPQLKEVIAIWHVKDGGAARLIYWAETMEVLRGENPHWIYPQFTTVLDQRPER